MVWSATKAVCVRSERLAQGREGLLVQQLQLESAQFERLKADFNYNLGLLRERDAELEKCDLEIASLRSQVETREAAEHELTRAAEDNMARACADAKRARATQEALAEAEEQARTAEAAAARSR